MSNSIKNDKDFDRLLNKHEELLSQRVMLARLEIIEYIDKHVEREIEKSRKPEPKDPVEIFNEIRNARVFRIPAKNMFDIIELFSPVGIAIKKELCKKSPLLNVLYPWVHLSADPDRECFVVLRVSVSGVNHCVCVHLDKKDGFLNIDVETIARVLLFRLDSKLSTVHRHASK